ncbi:MAG TPA: thiamine pyrophosphate-dependent enzyme, partial [Halanaerobiales bacterium]|nr:thiamine pyrophosphate-dependent enzyme [Halanaerobiales bacterium]
PVKIVILNNSSLGMVRQWQELFFNKKYASTILKNPDFAKLAEAFGIYGLVIDKKEDVKSSLRKAFKHDGPVVLDVRVDQNENVYPMVPAGAGINEMIGG